MVRRIPQQKLIVGWREWITLPDLGIFWLNAKVDTGAKTSALHAFNIKTFTRKGKRFVRFEVHPLERREDITIKCTAEVIDERVITDSGGHKEKRLVIKTRLQIASRITEVEITLTDRKTMQHRMLLGRAALSKVLVNPKRSHLTGQPEHIEDVYKRKNLI